MRITTQRAPQMDEQAIVSAYREIREAAADLRLTTDQRSRLWSGIGHLWDAMHRNAAEDATTHESPLPSPEDGEVHKTP